MLWDSLEAIRAVAGPNYGTSVGKQPEVADLHEAGRQDVEQEAADELDRIELHDDAAVVMPGVSPAEAYLAIFKTEESSVGDGNPMRVAGHILEHMLGSSERRLGVDQPSKRYCDSVRDNRLAFRSDYGLPE